MKFLFLVFYFPIILFAEVPKNLIYIIADGMGPTVITATRIYARSSKGGLNLDKFKHLGMVKTYSATDYVTDSAASATALATGVKTYNKAIGVDINKKPLKTILDFAKAKKMATGIVTTSTVTHATPASFYAHHEDRNKENEIAKQVLKSDIDFLLGGGKKFFEATEISKLLSHNWQIALKKDDLLTVPLDKKVLGIFANNHIPYRPDRKKENYQGPDLKQMVFWSLDRFQKQKKNFVLIVEAARIDHALHDNEPEKAILETLELDELISGIRSKITNDTLIIVTSDHDTGGIALSGHGDVDKITGKTFLGKTKERSYITFATGPGKERVYKAYKAYHTAADVLIFAEGNGAENFTGFMNNIDIPKKLIQLFKWK